MNPKQNIPDLIKQLQLRMSYLGVTQKMIANQLYMGSDVVSNYNKRFLQRFESTRYRADEVIELIHICRDVITPIEAIRLIYWCQIPDQDVAINTVRKIFDMEQFNSALSEFQERYDRLHLEPIKFDLPNKVTQTQSVNLPFFSDIDVRKLIGVDMLIDDLLQTIENERVISIQGIGGIGKTSLALALSKHFVSLNEFDCVTWVSIEHKRLVNGVEEDTLGSVISNHGIISQLSKKLIIGTNPQDSFEIHIQKLTHFFHLNRCFVIIDNVETLNDIRDLMKYLDVFTQNETRFLFTSRVNVNTQYAIVTPYDIKQLSIENCHKLLTNRARERSMTINRDTTERIYNIVGGVPLALHLIASLLGDVDFEAFIASIESTVNTTSDEEKRIDALFKFIYMNLWQVLSANAKQLFIRLGRILPDTGRSLSWINKYYEQDDLRERLQELQHYYILMRYGDVLDANYQMHPLSKTFIQNQRYRNY